MLEGRIFGGKAGGRISTLFCYILNIKSLSRYHQAAQGTQGCEIWGWLPALNTFLKSVSVRGYMDVRYYIYLVFRSTRVLHSLSNVGQIFGRKGRKGKVLTRRQQS
uniref:Uncharacterized protein n=1 Tax=Cacopsylla melanoneura TaxID=428564 RepID=A0A8D9E8C6_9HEMI